VLAPPLLVLGALIFAEAVTASGSLLLSVLAGGLVVVVSLALWLAVGLIITVIIAWARGLPQCVKDLRRDLRADRARRGPSRLAGLPKLGGLAREALRRPARAGLAGPELRGPGSTKSAVPRPKRPGSTKPAAPGPRGPRSTKAAGPGPRGRGNAKATALAPKGPGNLSSTGNTKVTGQAPRARRAAPGVPGGPGEARGPQ